MSQTAAPNEALVVQLLSWVAMRPRTYGETMEAWRTSCPRLSIWEDAVSDRLVTVTPVQGAGMNGSAVVVTALGQELLAADA
jgi:hypothetical protein